MITLRDWLILILHGVITGGVLTGSYFLGKAMFLGHGGIVINFNLFHEGWPEFIGAVIGSVFVLILFFGYTKKLINK